MLLTRPGCNRSVVDHYDLLGNRIAESTERGLTLKEYIVAAGRIIAELDLRQLRTTPEVLDFSDVEPGRVAARTVVIQNDGGADVTIDQASLSNSIFVVGAPAVTCVAALALGDLDHDGD